MRTDVCIIIGDLIPLCFLVFVKNELESPKQFADCPDFGNEMFVNRADVPSEFRGTVFINTTVHA